MDGAVPADLARAIGLGGEMGRRFADFDWDSHPLGAPSGWSVELRAAVTVALTSRFPIVVWLGAQELFLVYNDAYLPMLGEKHPAALGMPGREVWWDIWESISPMLAGVVATGAATWSDDLLLPVVTGGRRHERYFTFSYSPIITVTGSVDGVFCAVTETTERVLGQRRLQILNTVAAAVMEARTVDEVVRAALEVCAAQPADLPLLGIYLDDPTTRTSVLHGGTPEVMGLMPASLEAFAGVGEAGGSQPGSRVIGDLAVRLPALASAFAPGSGPEQALVLRLSDAGPGAVGGWLVIGLNPRQVLNEQYRRFCRLLGNQVSAALATAGSYQRERQRADGLAELDRAKTAFLTNVSHEFRTPLTLLLGPLEDALIEARGQPTQVERLNTARRNAGRLLRLVTSLLDFSRVEAGRATTTPELVDVGALTAQIASSFTELCQHAGIDLVITCEPVVGEVDVQMWETIVLNLLSNAVKFTVTGSITVAVTATDANKIRVRVADTGAGIATEDLDRLFDRFYRATNTRGRSVEGSGIGLSLVRGLVQLHDGTVEIASEVDLGTTVTIDLPAVAEPSRAVRPVTELTPPQTGAANPFVAEAMQWLDTDPITPVPAAAGSDAARRPLVLIADDNADMRRHLHRILSDHWDTVAFGDGDSALRGVRQHRPDMVVTDVMMPGLDGFGFVAALRADPQLASIPVLMLSARASAQAAEEGFASGADDYLPKPFRSHDLLNRVTARLTAAQRDRTTHQRDTAQAHQATARAQFTTALNTASTIEDILTALLASPTSSLQASAAEIALPDSDGDQIRLHHAGAVPAELRDRYHRVAPDAPIPIVEAIHTGQPLIITDTFDLATRYHVLVRDSATSIRASAIHPLRNGNAAVLGALALHWPTPRALSAAELTTLTTVAATISAAVERVRTTHREHRIAIDFQDRLLDLDRRSTFVAVAAAYQPAAEAMRVGGDWYLVAPLDDPRCVAVSVGDVVGHGLHAATVMSKLRSASTAAALTTADPPFVLDLLERYAATVPGAYCATVAYALIDTHTETISYACAGHPYPLIITPIGVARYLEHGRRPPLAAAQLTASSPVEHTEFPPGSLLILYTDGLIERHGESLDDGFARLAAAATDCQTLPVNTVCAKLLTALAPPGGYTDDVAVLAVRPAAITPNSFVTTLSTNPAELPALRHRLRAWLTDLHLDDTRQHDLILAVNEALSNAIEHGSDPTPHSTVTLEIFATTDTISATVSDTGQWARDSSASHRATNRGRGLTLINGLSDRVDTIRTSRGTHTTMHHPRTPPPASGSPQ